MKKKKIAVFGATGFVGMHLCKSLIKHGYEIVVFVRTNKVFPLSKLDKDKTSIVLCGNLNKIKDLGYDFNKVDCIINCAAKAHIQHKENINEKKYINELTNIERNIVNNVKNLNLKIIHISSAKVLKLIENKYDKDIDIYTKAKLESEKIIKEKFNNYVILRPPIIYGPGVRANFLTLIKAINSNLPLPLKGIKNNRSYLYIENLLDVILKIILKNNIKKNTYFVCDGNDISTYELCKSIAKHLSKKIYLFHLNKNILELIFRIFKKKDILDKIIGNFSIDNKKISSDLGWTPKIKTDEGIKKTCFWYKRRFNINKG